MDHQQQKAIVADGVEVPIDDAVLEEDANIGKKIVSGGAWRIAAYAGSTLLAVAATSVISRAIGPAEFALLTTCLSLLAVGMQVSDFGLLALGVREYAAQRGEKRIRGFRALSALRLCFSAVAMALILGFVLLADFPTEMIVGLAAALLGLLLMSLQSSFIVPLQATYRLNALAAIDITRQALTSALMVVVALTVGTVGAIISMNLPVSLLVVVIAGVIVRGEVPLRPSWDPRLMRALLADVGTFAVAASIGTLYPYVAQIASDAVLSPHDSGQFALAFRIYSVMLLGWMVAISGAFPLLVTTSREDAARMIYATRRLLQTSLLVGGAALAALMAGAEFVVAVLGGAEFADATTPVMIIGLALPATFSLVTGSAVLLASGKHRELVTVSVAGATTSVLITCLAAAEWGPNGAASGIVIGELLIASGYLFSVRGIDASALPKLGWLTLVMVTSLLACAVVLLDLPGLIAAILSLLVFLVVGLLLRVFPPELTDKIPLFGGGVRAD